MDNEIWKDIEELNGDYQISNLGRLKRTKKYRNQFTEWESNKILKWQKDKDGYLVTSIKNPLTGKYTSYKHIDWSQKHLFLTLITIHK